jgi:hypothetical protein
MRIPRYVWAWCAVLCAARLWFVLFFVLSGHPEAALRLAHVPSEIIDFPASLVYFLVPQHASLLESVVGPIWWFLMPLGVWWLIWGRRRKVSVNSDDHAI